METCWANILGDCAGSISGEHIISESLFVDDSIGVKGLPWCRETHKFIGKASFVSNILCRKHNSDLSPVDSAGAHAFDGLRSVAKVYRERADMLRYAVWAGRWDDIEHIISGTGLERWLLKTLVNMELAGKQGLGIGAGMTPGKIDGELIRIAFGSLQFQERAGLYFAAFDGEAIDSRQRVQYTSWVRDAAGGSYVAAGAFLLYGFRFFLCLERAGFPESLEVQGRELRLLRHLERINIDLNNKPSQHVLLSWSA